MYGNSTAAIAIHWCRSQFCSSDVLEAEYKAGLKTFLRVAYKNPQISFALHCSGHIFRWLARAHREVIDVLGEFIESGRIEILGGAFYEPFSSFVPRMDYSGQIELYSDTVRHLFGQRPRGFWLPASLWDPSLLPLLSRAGMRYTFLSTDEFIRCGSERSGEPHVIEHDGKSIVVFPTCQRPAKELFSRNSTGRSAAPDDDHCPVVSFAAAGLSGISEAQMQRWMDACKEAPALCTPRTMYQSISELPSISIPESNYGALVPAPSARWKDGTVKSCLDQYIESRMLYAKMRYLHILVRQFRGDKARKIAAKKALWNAQSHYVFWNGADTGIRSSELRHAHYRALIEAEKTLRLRGVFVPSLLHIDYDFDCLSELLYSGHDINVYIHRRGASIFEIDWLRRFWNYGNVYTGSDTSGGPEAVHSRRSFSDHFFARPRGSKPLMPRRSAELGDFVNCVYRLVEIDRQKKTVDFAGEGRVDGREVSIEKHFSFLRNAVSVEYLIRSPDHSPQHVLFSPEILLSFAEGAALTVYGKPLPITLFEEDEIRVEDAANEGSISLAFSQPASCYCTHEYAPGYGSGNKYQCTAFFPYWKINLGDESRLSITLKIDAS